MTVVKRKKQKGQKGVFWKNLKCENYKYCFEATKLENKKYLEKNKVKTDSLKKSHKEFIKNNKSISKTQERFKSERRNVFTEEVNKIALSSNDNKSMESVDSRETYAYGTTKDPVSEKEEIKCNSIIKWYKKWLTLMILQSKTEDDIIQITCKFLIIHKEY